MFALQVINGLTCNIKEVGEPTRPKFNQRDSNKVRSYFYFAGPESGLEFSCPLDKESKSPSIGKTAWPFQKGYTAVIKFKCCKTKVLGPDS